MLGKLVYLVFDIVDRAVGELVDRHVGDAAILQLEMDLAADDRVAQRRVVALDLHGGGGRFLDRVALAIEDFQAIAGVGHFDGKIAGRLLCGRLPRAAELLIEARYGQRENVAFALAKGRLGLHRGHFFFQGLDLAVKGTFVGHFLGQIAGRTGDLARQSGLRRRVLDPQARHHDHDDHDAHDARHDIEERVGVDGFFVFGGAV